MQKGFFFSSLQDSRYREPDSLHSYPFTKILKPGWKGDERKQQFTLYSKKREQLSLFTPPSWQDLHPFEAILNPWSASSGA